MNAREQMVDFLDRVAFHPGDSTVQIDFYGEKPSYLFRLLTTAVVGLWRANIELEKRVVELEKRLAR